MAWLLQVMGNRKIRVDVAEGEGVSQRRGFTDRGGRDEERLDRSEGVSDWRAAPRDAPPRDGMFCFHGLYSEMVEALHP